MFNVSKFSQQNLPILLGKQEVRFTDEALKLWRESKSLETVESNGKVGRAIILHLQLVANGAKTASAKEANFSADFNSNTKFLDAVRIPIDGKTEGDEFGVRLFYKHLRDYDESFKEKSFEEIIGHLMGLPSFTVYLSRSEKGYLQMSLEEPKKKDEKPASKTDSGMEKAENTELPF